MNKPPSSERGKVFNELANDFPNEPGWYFWKPFDGIKVHHAEYVMVNHDPAFNGKLRVWRAGSLYGNTLPVETMIGEWNFFMKLNTEKPE